jgi:hypothetical protein
VNESTEGLCRCFNRGEVGTGFRGTLCGEFADAVEVAVGECGGRE